MPNLGLQLMQHPAYRSADGDIAMFIAEAIGKRDHDHMEPTRRIYMDDFPADKVIVLRPCCDRVVTMFAVVCHARCECHLPCVPFD